MALKLRVGEFDGNDGNEAFAAVVAGQSVVPFDNSALFAVIVDGTGQCSLKARLVSTAFNRRHVVGKRNDCFVVTVVILHGDFGNRAVFLAFHVDNVGMHGGAALFVVEIFNERDDTAFVAKVLFSFLIFSLIAKNDMNTRIQKCLFSHTGQKNLKIKHRFFENGGVGFEMNRQTVLFFTGTFTFERSFHFSFFKALGIFDTVAVVFDLHPLGECVDDGGADTVKTAGNFITFTAELTAGVQNGIYDLQSGKTEFFVHTRGNTAAVVFYRDTVIFFHRHTNGVTGTGKCFVNRVVDNFKYQVVKTADRRRTDIHTGAFSDCFESFQHLNLTVVIFVYVFVFFHDVSFRFLWFQSAVSSTARLKSPTVEIRESLT